MCHVLPQDSPVYSANMGVYSLVEKRETPPVNAVELHAPSDCDNRRKVKAQLAERTIGEATSVLPEGGAWLRPEA